MQLTEFTTAVAPNIKAGDLVAHPTHGEGVVMGVDLRFGPTYTWTSAAIHYPGYGDVRNYLVDFEVDDGLIITRSAR
jgi:hypothetical protein